MKQPVGGEEVVVVERGLLLADKNQSCWASWSRDGRSCFSAPTTQQQLFYRLCNNSFKDFYTTLLETLQQLFKALLAIIRIRKEANLSFRQRECKNVETICNTSSDQQHTFILTMPPLKPDGPQQVTSYFSCYSLFSMLLFCKGILIKKATTLLLPAELISNRLVQTYRMDIGQQQGCSQPRYPSTQTLKRIFMLVANYFFV